MAIDSANLGKLISAVKDIILAAIGATVFIYGFVHATPITTEVVEYLGVFASYYGVHVYRSGSVNKTGETTSNPVTKP